MADKFETLREYCREGRYAIVRQKWTPEDPNKNAWEGIRLVTFYQPKGKDEQYGKGVALRPEQDEDKHIMLLMTTLKAILDEEQTKTEPAPF